MAMKLPENWSGGAKATLILTASTLYSALRRLESRGLVSSSWQYIAKQKRRCYELTEKGRQILAEELAQWEKFLGATDRVIDSQ